ncbi:MAG TPA: hypothetical protein DEO40_03125, partial [Treponema sp.]|nr:hypothetical protein [Treponema sp.]
TGEIPGQARNDGISWFPIINTRCGFAAKFQAARNIALSTKKRAQTLYLNPVQGLSETPVFRDALYSNPQKDLELD